MEVLLIRSTSILNDSRATKEIKSLLKSGFKVTVLGWDREKRNKTDEKIAIAGNCADLHFLKLKCSYAGGMKNFFKMGIFQIWIALKMLKYRKNYHIVQCCDYDTSILALPIAKLLKKKVVYDIYDYYTESHNLGKLKKCIEKQEIKTINKADLVIICTEQRKQQIAKASPKKLIVIHNSPDISYKTQKYNKQNEKLKICYVGILSENRLLEEVTNEIIKRDDIELHIGGFGEKENFFENLSKKYDNIKFYGSLKYEEVLKLESKCDVLFATYNPKIPNHKYSAPNKVYEAMALDKPIIVCKNTGIDKLVVQEQIGIAINYNGEDFIKAIDKIKNKNFTYKEGNGRKLYQEKYGWKIMEKNLIKSYKEL